MKQYCPGCNIQYRQTPVICPYCATAPPEKEDVRSETATMLYFDFAQLPLLKVLGMWRDLNTVHLVFFPVLFLIIMIKKLFRKPWFFPVLNSVVPKLQMADTNAPDVRKALKAAGPVTAVFVQKGFENVLNLKMLHFQQPVFQAVLADPERTRYAAVTVHMDQMKVTETGIQAITAARQFILVSDRDDFALQLPSNLISRKFHRVGTEALLDAFENVVADNAKPLMPLSLASYLKARSRVEIFSCQQRLRQGILTEKQNVPKSDAVPETATCVHHPANMAVRCCTDCDAALCESCYTLENGKPFCTACRQNLTASLSGLSDEKPLAMPAPQPLSQPVWPGESVAFAGLGARGLATLIDLIVVSAVAALACYGLYLVFSFTAGRYAPALSMIAAQLVTPFIVVFYFTSLFSRWHGGVGHRILGLRVTGENGGAPSVLSGLIRLVYMALGFLFVFPFAGYLLIPFRAKKCGLHDTLAGTVVVTRHPRRAAITGWVGLVILGMLILFAGMGILDFY